MFHLVDLAVAENPIFQTPLRFSSMALPYSSGDVRRVAVFSKVPLPEIKPAIGNKVEIVSLVFDEKDNIVGFDREEADFSALSARPAYHYFAMSLNPGKLQVPDRDPGPRDGERGRRIRVCHHP